MKISWGVKITILYSGFVILIITLVAMAMNQKVELVSNDYYQQELEFQNRINKSNRAKLLKVPLTWKVMQGSVEINFPEEFSSQKIEGNIYFFRPSDSSLDKSVDIPAGNSTTRNISTVQMKRGVYKMEISWKINNEEYYNEGFVNLN